MGLCCGDTVRTSVTVRWRIGDVGALLIENSSQQHTYKTMNIQQTIQAYTASKAEADRIQALPNSQYDPASHYAAIDRASVLAYRMINHPDWTVELQNQHYPQGVGAVAYPVSS